MNVITTRFGTIRVSESELLRLTEGLIGFRGQSLFLLMADPEAPGLSWLQSVTAPELAFGLVLPTLALPDYRIELRPGDLASLELDDERDAQIYLILNRSEAGGLAVNLQGPLVVNPVRRLGRQLVMTSSRYAVRYPLSGTVPSLSTFAVPAAMRASA